MRQGEWRARQRLVSARAATTNLCLRLGRQRSHLCRLGRGRCGRRGAKASARALKLPQRPARYRGRALAAASVLGWPGGRARATLHQLLVMPLRDAAASSPRFFATAPLPPSAAAPLRSNDAPKPLLGTAFALFFSSATGSMIAIEALEPPPRRAAGLPWPRSTPSIHRRSLQPNFLGPSKTRTLGFIPLPPHESPRPVKHATTPSRAPQHRSPAPRTAKTTFAVTSRR